MMMPWHGDRAGKIIQSWVVAPASAIWHLATADCHRYSSVEVKHSLDNIDAVLKAAGNSSGDVVSVPVGAGHIEITTSARK